MTGKTHDDLWDKIVEHEAQLLSMVSDIKGIRQDLDPISKAAVSIAWSFKALLIMGAGSAAVVGIIELIDHM